MGWIDARRFLSLPTTEENSRAHHVQLPRYASTVVGQHDDPT